MLTAYIRAALHRAAYEQLPDGTWFGHVDGLQGVWTEASSREACHSELQAALEDWIVFRLVNGFHMPVIDGIELSAARVA